MLLSSRGLMEAHEDAQSLEEMMQEACGVVMDLCQDSRLPGSHWRAALLGAYGLMVDELKGLESETQAAKNAMQREAARLGEREEE